MNSRLVGLYQANGFLFTPEIFNKHYQAGLPGLNLLEGLELGHRDEDHDGLLAPGALHLRVRAHWDKGKVQVRGKGEGRVHPGGMRTK